MFKSQIEDQKKLIDQLESQKVDQKLDYDNQLYNLERGMQADHVFLLY